MSFEIFAVSAGNGQLALSRAPAASGDLARDVSTIQAWGATVVVSLTEAREMADLGAGSLEGMLSDAKIRWLHWPVADFDVPDARAMARWLAVQEVMLSALERGENVLVHCRGGCGRSGMVVLKLLCATGEGPEAALARLRAVRPCAVETAAQMVWATDGVLTEV